MTEEEWMVKAYAALSILRVAAPLDPNSREQLGGLLADAPAEVIDMGNQQVGDAVIKVMTDGLR